ncbi:glycoside hydrolase [Stereum hirsutum FP-91666 SS1]|uniref:glycoside hydrolase n=1 Tax=Stereum hirsutum (strain FP-91666) TaxID=721885 RepID=UPI000440AF67|nr:glycoside hydrolase [Stereum hirsutum FP-91666 SS1]EIM90018.1 glycoside hydrolase [Stereum hirsutum FP-91666 SS1]
MRPFFWLSFALNVFSSAYAYATPSRTIQKRAASNFISTQGDKFVVNGSDFSFIGTNAYWLPFLDSDDDISKVLANISASGIKVVRTWAFNDVTEIPDDGSSWLQLICNGKTEVNTGPNGLPKLDKFVQLAQDHGIYVLFSLTNNWNPIANATNPAPLARNFLSNSYGGMDAYVRAFGTNQLHDEFYTSDDIINFFQNYTQQVVSRFVDNPFVFGWELANDPRCGSTVANSDTCTTTTITKWHATVSEFIRSIDPNHLVASGNHGFQCPTCTKLFPITPTPTPSAAPGKRAPAGVTTPDRLMRDIAQRRKARAAAASRPQKKKREGPTIRGRWAAPASGSNAKRQTSSTGPSFDGSQGVDSQDILNIPDIGFGTFQFFPDQNVYTTDGETVPGSQGQSSFDFNNTVQEGIEWIQNQAAFANAVGKPLALTAFGLVTQDNFPFFVPFNSSVPLVNQTSLSRRTDSQGTASTSSQQQSAYLTWLEAGITAGVQGLTQYQFSAGGLTQGTSGTDSQGTSPNDGYSTQGTATVETLQQAAQEQQGTSS